jgi:hypothetical protein
MNNYIRKRGQRAEGQWHLYDHNQPKQPRRCQPVPEKVFIRVLKKSPDSNAHSEYEHSFRFAKYQLKWEEMKANEEEFMWFVLKIASFFREILSKMNLKSGKVSLDEMKYFSLNAEYAKFPNIIREFFETMTKSQTFFLDENHKRKIEQKKKWMIFSSLNAMSKAKDLKSINPFGLALSMCIYWTCGSRLVLDTLASFGVGVCWQTVQNYKKDYAELLPPNISKLDGDFVVWFDNIQKKWGGSRSSISCRATHFSLVTNVVAFHYNSKITFNHEFRPSIWRKKEAVLSSFLLTDDHNKVLNSFVESFLKELYEEEIKQKESELVTEYDTARKKDHQDRYRKKCPKCSRLYPNTKQVCGICIVKLPLVGDRVFTPSAPDVLLKAIIPEVKRIPVTSYAASQDGLQRQKPVSLTQLDDTRQEEEGKSLRITKSLLLDPEGVDPGSYVGVERVLNRLLKETPKREFLPVCVDGVPLQMIYQLVRENKKYEEILPLIGLGHEQMNMMSSFFSLIWGLWGPEFCVAHGYFSQLQQQRMKKISDTHKSFEGLQVMLEGILKEQMKEYLSLENSLPCSFADFLRKSGLQYPASRSSQHPFAWLNQTLLHGLEVLAFVRGVREQNFHLLNSARIAFMDVWFTHSHPIYRMNITSTIRDLSLMPDEVYNMISQWTIGTNTGNACKNQGLDFVGEELNKIVKDGLSCCVEEEDWREVTRLVPLIQQIKKEFGTETNINRHISHTAYREERKRPQLRSDVVSWRSVIREKKMILTPWTSITTGKSVTQESQNLFQIASTQKLEYIKMQILKHGPITKATPLTKVSFFPPEKKARQKRHN